MTTSQTSGSSQEPPSAADSADAKGAIPSGNRGEFRRYRQGLAGIYLSVAGVGVALLVASVIRGLFFPAHADASSVADLRECERELTTALERARVQIPAQLRQTLRSTEAMPTTGVPDSLKGATYSSGQLRKLPTLARLAARCARTATSPADRAIRDAADALSVAVREYRSLSTQFEQDVAGHLARADSALIRARALLTNERGHRVHEHVQRGEAGVEPGVLSP